MYLYLGLLAVTVFAAAIILLLWGVFGRSRNNRVLKLRNDALTCEELEDHARKTAIEHSVSRRQNLSKWPIPRMNDNYAYISNIYKGLNEDIRKKRAVPPAAEWLLDNFYIIEEQVKGLRRGLPKEHYSRLPVLKCGTLKGYARIFAVSVDIIAHTDGQINEEMLINYLKAYQSHGYLYDREIWAIPTFIRLALVEEIRQICERIRDTQQEWRRVDDIFDSLQSSEDIDTDKVIRLFKSGINTADGINPPFIEHLFFRLRRAGLGYSHVLKYIDEYLEKSGTTMDSITQREHNSQAVNAVSIGNCITSLKFVSSLDWLDVLESASHVEQILRNDPYGTYPLMDVPSRNYYRSRIEKLASEYNISEFHIAREAIELAGNACKDPGTDPGDAFSYRSQCHVGYYISGKGIRELENRLGYKSGPAERASGFLRKHPGLFYAGLILLITLIFVMAAMCYSYYSAARHQYILSVLAGIAVVIPASEIAVCLVNWIACKIYKPAVFPRLELKEGIPEALGTVIVIPALLSDEKRVNGLLENLESHYLSNREDNIYFALLGDFKDYAEASAPGDDRIISAALSGIEGLNRKYAGGGNDIFYYFHRERKFSRANNKWMGWERKRGALTEFNDMLTGSGDVFFKYSSNPGVRFPKVRYVITLDADTILPIGMAKKMIGTMAHPLNKPVIDPDRGIVTEGYGLMQPRIAFDIESSNRSLFSRIFTGQEGIDPYSCAVSDVYQDLFGEGIFTGKGIYDLKTFQTVLKDAIPENAVLSHDLLEGSYVRTALVTDLELVDSYPSKYNSYSARLHRWIRGDWQLLPWLGNTVRNRSGNRVKNPLTALSMWKILDNIRRSLVPLSVMVLILLGFCILAGSSFIWLAFSMVVLAIPLITAVIDYILSGHLGASRVKRHLPVITGLKAVFFQVLLAVVFLPYQAYLMLDAMVSTIVRVCFTGRNMLEWVTAADAERGQKNSPGNYYAKMYVTLLAGATAVVLAFLFNPVSLPAAVILLVVWAVSPYIAYHISREQNYSVNELPAEGAKELRRIARKTWRYFEDFANFRNHYLAPDNYQEDPPRGVAYRTSPTNIGLGLLASLSARDLGFIGILEMTELISNTVSTMENMDKWNGHLYNWYDTRTLRPLRPAYVSTVDSGNLVCYLITLKQGLYEYLERPVFDAGFANGIGDTLGIIGIGKGNPDLYRNIGLLGGTAPGKSLDPVLWYRTLYEIGDDLRSLSAKKLSWEAKALHMVKMFKNEISELAPWVELVENVPDGIMNNDLNKEVGETISEIINLLKGNAALKDLPGRYRQAAGSIEKLRGTIAGIPGGEYGKTLEWLAELQFMAVRAAENTEGFIERYMQLIGRIDSISRGIEFSPLYVEKKQLFSIGYNIEENRLTNSFYDLLASEARQTSYIAIARGEVPPKHWFKMGRALTVVDGYKGLVSWTGTMFEYLMPLLLMKSYRNTLLDETYSFVIRSQKKYGKQRGMPWGASESGFNSLDINLDYQYKAIGVPWLGLKRGLIQDAVASPYSTFLALLVDPRAAYENVRHLRSEGLEGTYGYYEAVDYTPERLPFGEKRAIVKSYMAHHQGMSLLALNNYLNGCTMQVRFHADPVVRSARLLLQEKVPTNLIFTKETKEKVIPFKDAVYKEKGPVRKYSMPDPVLPKTHMLSNGNYLVMLTDKGTGYSRSKMAAITRWREDSTLDYYGMFFYLRDVDTNSVWTNTYAPFYIQPDKYEVLFTADKARFRRVDGEVETVTEVVVASGDNAEIRRLSLKNLGKAPRIIEVTSYFEVVMAPQAADVAHPAFSNLFVKTEFLHEKRRLVANRRPRSEADKSPWLANTAVVEGEALGDVQYETDRMQFLGRGHNVTSPTVIKRNKPLSNTVGPVLDPVMCLRTRVRIEPGKTARVSFVTAFSEYEDTVLELSEKYSNPEAIEGAFRLALIRSQVEARYLNRKASELKLYQDMLSGIIFLSPARRIYNDLAARNTRGQSSLWAYGISGDLPIILVVLRKTDEVDILHEILKAHEYWQVKGLKIDLVVLSSEENSYTNPLYGLLSDIVQAGYTHDILNKPGGVFILDKNKMPEEDLYLLYAVARIILKGECGSVADQVKQKHRDQLPQRKDFTERKYEYVQPEPEETELEYFNGIGGFSHNGSEYVIRLEKGQNTPAPWINVISNPAFGFLVSESGSGYTWCENSRENKLTPWSNDPVSEPSGEAFYIGDGDTGEIWGITALPVRDDEPYIIRHGFGYSVFEHVTHGIEHSMTQFVPVNEAVKVSIVKLRNVSLQERNLTVTYYIRPVLGVSDQATAMHIRTSLGETGALLVENPYNEEFPGRICFVDVSLKERSFTGNRKEFLGSGGLHSPEGLKRERLSGTVGAGYDPCAALQVSVILSQGEEKEIVFTLGMAGNMREVDSITSKYKNLVEVRKSLDSAMGFWEEKLGTIRVKTPDMSMDLMLNGWLMYQVISCRLWARSAFYQSGGAFGFRDQLQDCLPVMQVWPEVARDQILFHARHQFVEGDVQHWWHEPQGKGTRTRFSDDLLWLPYVTSEYIRVTGDSGILDVDLPFLEDEVLKEFEDERYSVPRLSDTTASLYEHCIRAIERSLRFGSHSLPLMGSGDWNDGMSTVGNLGSGESVWLGWFLYTVLDKFSAISLSRGDKDIAGKYTGVKHIIADAIEKNAWDGNWYRRAYFDSGIPLGSMQNSECKIDSIAQTWSVISGAGKPERSIQALDSLEEYLVQREDGLIKLLTPPFDEGDLEPGYIKGYVPGVRENGGQYTHAAAWVVIAFAKLGEGDKAWEFFELVNPVNHSRTHIEYSRYRVEPYVMAADVYAVHPHTGRGGWTWYTGSAAWFFRAGLEYLLGFQKNGDSVTMDPCIPRKWREYEISYKFMDTDYLIKVLNPNGINKGVESVTIDGVKTLGNNFKLVNDGTTHTVEVLMG